MPKETVCIIPARGGSKRIPRKNVALLAGKPLIVHTIEQARAAQSIGAVYVSTEDAQIASVSKAAGTLVIERPASLASDTATSESALLHALDAIRAVQGEEPEWVVFLQCTSPIRREGDIDNAIRTLIESQADSLFSVCEEKGLLWQKDGREWKPVNYDYNRRQPEQNFPEQVRENGSIYVFKPWVLRKLNCRLGGRIATYKMDYWCSFQVDRPENLKLCEWILRELKFS